MYRDMNYVMCATGLRHLRVTEVRGIAAGNLFLFWRSQLETWPENTVKPVLNGTYTERNHVFSRNFHCPEDL
jgi:hypothetical protein